MDTSHIRPEKMMQSLLHKVGSREGIAGDDMQTQASSAKLVDTSILKSTMAEIKMVPPELALPPLLNVVNVVDVSSPSALLVCIDVIKDVAVDVIMNKSTDHASNTTNIVTMVKNVVHEDRNKALESDVIVDMAEDAVDEVVGQSGMA